MLNKVSREYLLVEPIAKTPYPPLGLMKISTMLKKENKNSKVYSVVGRQIPKGLMKPSDIYITSLFTWDLNEVVGCFHYFKDQFPKAAIHLGGIAASLLPDRLSALTGAKPHVGLLNQAEKCSPDYDMSFGRRVNSSITFASRGCPRKCRYCCVKAHEPQFFVKEDWVKDVSLKLPRITFWDNNWLASPNIEADVKKLIKLGKSVDFNQGLDARLFTEQKAQMLKDIKINPLRFAFDNISQEKEILKAISLAKKYCKSDIRVYVLYNFDDSPEDFYYRINLLNKNGVLAFPMEYRKPTDSPVRFPGPNWNSALLRALKLSLLFYYRKGMITESKKSFNSIYGKNAKEFESKLYKIYEKDKSMKR